MSESIKLDVNDKGDTGVAAFGCPVVLIAESES